MRLGEEPLLLLECPARLFDLVGQAEPKIIDAGQRLLLIDDDGSGQRDLPAVADQVLEAIDRFMNVHACAPSGSRGSRAETLFERCDDVGWDEFRNVSTELGEFLDQAGAEKQMAQAGRDEDGGHVGLQAPVHQRHLELTLEV